MIKIVNEIDQLESVNKNIMPDFIDVHDNSPEIIIGMLWRRRLSTPHTDFGAILEIIEATK
jgi:hypothetical protein